MEGRIDTSLLDRAIRFAVQAHSGTERRGKGFPYVAHPMEAMAIVATMTSDQEILAAAALHDVVEDTDVTIDEIRSLFGDRIARLVDAESDRTGDGMDWRSRKEDSLRRLKEGESRPFLAVPCLGRCFLGPLGNVRFRRVPLSCEPGFPPSIVSAWTL